MKKIKEAAERILPVLFWLLLMLAFDSPYITIATLLAAALHELGHISVMLILSCGNEGTMPRAVISGFRLRPSRLLSYKEEILLAAGGPLFNILTCIALLFFRGTGGGYFSIFALLNLLTAISNLIPIKGYDGYRIIRCFAAERLGDERCDALMRRISGIFASVAVFFSLYLIMKIGEGYWIFSIFFAILVKDVLKMQNITNSEIKRDFERF